MRVLVALALALMTACGAAIGGQELDPDGGPPGPDSPVIPPDTMPVCQKPVIFLSFEGGETLTDAPASDAKQNLASWMTGVTSATAPAYKAADANRATIIQTIINEATTRLAPFTSVVTTRPTSGDYMMIVFGGDRLVMGSNFNFVQELDCGDQVRNDVAWVSDTFPTTSIPNAILGSIGFGIGLTGTTDPTDCMCAWDNVCSPNTTECLLHDGIARDPNANQQCPGAPAVQDEIVAFNVLFCN